MLRHINLHLIPLHTISEVSADAIRAALARAARSAPPRTDQSATGAFGGAEQSVELEPDRAVPRILHALIRNKTLQDG